MFFSIPEHPPPNSMSGLPTSRDGLTRTHSTSRITDTSLSRGAPLSTAPSRSTTPVSRTFAPSGSPTTRRSLK